MKIPVASALLASVMAACFILPAWSAEVATDKAQVKQQAGQLPALAKAAAKAAGLKAVTVRSAAHQLTVTVTDSPLAGALEREAQASRIAAAIEAGIEKKPAFTQISVIHVDYVKRAGQGSSPVHGFDFFQTPTGAFVLHKT
jgi:hypothetical protein